MNCEILTSNEEFAVKVKTFLDRETGEFHHVVTRGMYYHPSEEGIVKELMEIQELELRQKKRGSITTLVEPLGNEKYAEVNFISPFYCNRN